MPLKFGGLVYIRSPILRSISYGKLKATGPVVRIEVDLTQSATAQLLIYGEKARPDQLALWSEIVKEVRRRFGESAEIWYKPDGKNLKVTGFRV